MGRFFETRCSTSSSQYRVLSESTAEKLAKLDKQQININDNECCVHTWQTCQQSTCPTFNLSTASTSNSERCIHWVTSLFGLSFAESFDETKLQTETELNPKSGRFWFGLSQSLSKMFHWVRTLDSAIRSAKVNLNNSVSVQFTLYAVDSLIR